MHVQRVAISLLPHISQDASLNSRGSPSDTPLKSVGNRATLGHGEPDEERRHGHDKPAMGPRDADVEEHALAGNRLADADERASVPVKGSGAGRKNGSDASTS